jgi:hypothetical protein
LAIGTERYEGVGFEIFDPYGLYYHYLFIRQPVDRQILPASLELKQPTQLRKPINQLLQAGQNRHLVGGSSSELLEIRDYVEGDSFRRVAWKLSAKRERLLSKSYEQEVPIRCQIFVDASALARQGPIGKSFFDRSVTLACSLARSLMQRQDPVGLSIYSNSQVQQLRPALGSRHWQRMQSVLIGAVDTDSHVEYDPLALTKRAEILAQVVYPELWQLSKPGRDFAGMIVRFLQRFSFEPKSWMGFLVRSLALLGTSSIIGVALGMTIATGFSSLAVIQTGAGVLILSIVGYFILKRLAAGDTKRQQLARVINVTQRGSLADLAALQHIDTYWQAGLKSNPTSCRSLINCAKFGNVRCRNRVIRNSSSCLSPVTAWPSKLRPWFHCFATRSHAGSKW